MTSERDADVCLVLEGTYPYVTGGVSNWVHDLIQAQDHLQFQIVALVPPGPEMAHRFKLPANVVGLTRIELQTLPEGVPDPPGLEEVLQRLEAPLLALTSTGGLEALREVIEVLDSAGSRVARVALLDSPPAWQLLQRMCEWQCPTASFVEYFWTWRTMLLGMYSVLRSPLVRARSYHALCTGYAGLYAARAHVATGRPVILTEHGIYTNERRVEITMADWLQTDPLRTLSVDRRHRDLRDLWIDTFTSYSRACYAACRHIVTLYEGNTQLQLRDGADPNKLRVIPNGIAPTALKRPRQPDGPPTVALIGRVVPIKDIKTFLRACALLRDAVPDVRVWVLGGFSEDPPYYEECLQMSRHLALEQTVEFKGQVSLEDYFPDIDVIALTSISEAQPLVILEAASAGIPAVATDVGSCRELILGRPDEHPPLGPSGAITPLANPGATAEALRSLLTDRATYARCSVAGRERVRRTYDKGTLDRAYAALYADVLDTSTQMAGA